MTNVREVTSALIVAATLVGGAASAQSAPPAKPGAARAPIPVILATDIGDDIDDVWALALALHSPELDLKLVVTDYGDTVYRARIVARYLELAGRSDVAIGIGVRQWQKDGPQPTQGYELARYPGRILDDGVQALIGTVMSSKEPMTLIAIGPPPTLHAALVREPRIAEKLRFVGMYGSLHEGYAEKSKAEPEWNVKAIPAASRALLGAAWRDALVTPLDTCGRVVLDGERYARIRASQDPLTRALVADYHQWCPKVEWCSKEPGYADTRSTTLFDTVAVYLAFADDLVTIERTGVRVDDAGMTLADPAARPLRWATAWKSLDGFRDLLVTRLAGSPVTPAPKPTAQ
jgi:inosine-uridine nucleoside N-ribohydrolase